MASKDKKASSKRPPMKAPMKGGGLLGKAMRAKEKRKKMLESM